MHEGGLACTMVETAEDGGYSSGSPKRAPVCARAGLSPSPQAGGGPNDELPTRSHTMPDAWIDLWKRPQKVKGLVSLTTFGHI